MKKDNSNKNSSNTNKDKTREFSDYLKSKVKDRKKSKKKNQNSSTTYKKKKKEKSEFDFKEKKTRRDKNKTDSKKETFDNSLMNKKNQFNTKKDNQLNKNHEKNTKNYTKNQENSDQNDKQKKEVSIYGVLKKDNRLYTKNLVPKHKTYDEKLIYLDDVEYREWNPNKSKIGSAIKKNIKIDFNKKMNVLYLGASTGTTVSHLSDIITEGNIFAVEFATRVFRELIFESQKRKNVLPILADASKVEEYIQIVPQVDLVFQDIAQKNQAQIFVKNMKLFLKKKGIGMIAVKARSIDVTKKPRQVYKDVEEYIRRNNFEVLKVIPLNPYEKDHAIIICRN